MGLANGVHHLAICTKDIKKQIEFFTQHVGMELVALYWMHGVDKTFHGFLKLGDSSSIAFCELKYMRFADIFSASRRLIGIFSSPEVGRRQ